MAILDTLRLRDILARGGVSEPAATEFVTETDESLEAALEQYATNSRVDLALERLLRAIAELEARQARHINQAVGITLAGIALAVGIILGFG